MKVTLTRVTENPILAIEEAASNCYDSEATGDGKIMKHCIKSGHTSVTEFCDFTFHIEGISRTLSHQLVRHRLASYAQRSQRYCSENSIIIKDVLQRLWKRTKIYRNSESLMKMLVWYYLMLAKLLLKLK